MKFAIGKGGTDFSLCKFLIAYLLPGVCFGQQVLTLSEAEQIALRTHPALQSSQLSAQAAVHERRVWFTSQ